MADVDPETVDPEVIVRGRLAAAGFPASDAEVAVLVAGYAGMQGMKSVLYQAVPGRDVPLALRYDPAGDAATALENP